MSCGGANFSLSQVILLIIMILMLRLFRAWHNNYVAVIICADLKKFDKGLF